jgi:flagellin-like hook-associated protein FlgL
LEALKVDVTKNPGDIENYDKEIENLQSEIVKIREEKFNGVRLFSPNKTADSIEVDAFPLNNSVVSISRPPLPKSFGADPLEIVILADVSGSMDSYINDVKNGMASLINSLNTSDIKSWGIKVVGYPASVGNISGSGNSFIYNTNADPLSAINNQFDSLPRHSVGQGEPLIEAMDDISSIAWSNNRDAKKAIFAFTDEEITTTPFATQNRSDIAKKIKDLEIDFNLLTEAHNDQWTNELIADSGGIKGDLTDGLQNTTQFFQNYAQSLIDDPFDLDDLSDFIAQNGASQSAIRNLVDSVKINRQNISMASSRIKDVDIASETTKLSSLKVIQEAGVAMLSQANISQQSIMRLLEG